MPEWKATINLRHVFHNEAMTFEQRRDAIVRCIRSSSWAKGYAPDSAFHGFVDELADAKSSEEFDAPWGELYDYADADRVWIATF
jgi:hypothetical protein